MDDFTGAALFLGSAPFLGGFAVTTVTVFIGLRFLIDWIRKAEGAA